MTRSPVIRASIAALCFALSSLAFAADKVWVGSGATRNWSEGANWQDGTAPGPGDRLFFQPSPQRQADNDIPNGTYDSVWFSGDDFVHTIFGLPITLTGDDAVTATSRTVAFVVVDITFTSTHPRILTTGTATPNDRRPIVQFANAHLTFSGGVAAAVAEVGAIEFGGDIGETSPTRFDVSGVDVSFFGNNTFSGGVTSASRWFGVDSNNAMGTAATGTLVVNPARLGLLSNDLRDLVIPEPFTLANDSADEISGSVVAVVPLRLTGPVIVAAPQVFQVHATLALEGVVSGRGSIEVGRDTGTMILTNADNTFDGGIKLTQGALRLANSFVVPAANSVDIGSVTTLDMGATQQVFSSLACHGHLRMTLATGKLTTSGPVTLGNCTLDLAIPPGYIPQSREVMTVLQNNGNAAYDQNFVGYPEGTVVNVNGVNARATYAAGSGRDFAFVADSIPVSSLSVVSGTPQSIARGSASGTPFVARGLDAWGRPASGARVTFTASPGCGTFGGSASAQVNADAQGIARAPFFTAGTTSQVCTVQATGDAGGSAIFEVHVYAPAEVVLTTSHPSLYMLVNQTIQIWGELRGANGMSLPNLTVTFEAVTRGNSGPASLTPSALTDAANSRANATLVCNNKAGNYDIVVRFGSFSRTIPVSQKQ